MVEAYRISEEVSRKVHVQIMKVVLGVWSGSRHKNELFHKEMRECLLDDYGKYGGGAADAALLELLWMDGVMEYFEDRKEIIADTGIRVILTRRAPYEIFEEGKNYLATTYAWDENSWSGRVLHMVLRHLVRLSHEKRDSIAFPSAGSLDRIQLRSMNLPTDVDSLREQIEKFLKRRDETFNMENTYRQFGKAEASSEIDVTLCNAESMDMMEGWRVEDNVMVCNHNLIVFYFAMGRLLILPSSVEQVNNVNTRVKQLTCALHDAMRKSIPVVKSDTKRHDYGIIVPKHVGQNIIGFLLNADYLPKE
uniref:Uncharacterized protein n=1 Tax=Timema douglasi TaxID=61478 RepID=A0A7R8VTT2_TIMDO|nr:unnamed protein product [Timema douglasi]